MRTTWFAVLAMAVVATGIALYFARGDRSASAALAPEEDGLEQPVHREALEAPAGVELPQAAQRVAGEAEAEPTVEPASADQTAAAATEKVRVEGTVVVVDEEGVAHSGLDGSIAMFLWTSGNGLPEEVEVRGGAWSLEVDPGAELGVTSMKLGGRVAVLVDDPAARFPVDAGVVALRARWLARTLLHVVDDATGAPLDGLTVLSVSDWRRSDLGHPGESGGERMVVDGRSPVALEPTRFQVFQRNTPLFVHAPGYAWGRIQVDLSHGGERELRLVPEARLEVVLTGAPPHERAVLRLYTEEGGLRYTELDVKRRDRFALDGLLPGAYAVRVEVGDWWDRPLGQAEEQVELRPGEAGTVTLDIAPPPDPDRARLAGVVVIPPEWELPDARLSIDLKGTALDGGEGRETLYLAQMAPVAGEPGARRFDAGRVQIGRYELTLSEVEYSILVEVPLGGREDVRLELPPPALISVEVLDDVTGLPAEVERLHWHCEREGGGGLESVRRDDETGRFEFRAPQCRVQLSAWSELYQPWSEIVDVRPGTNAVTVRAKPACAVTLRLMDGETPVPWDGHWYPGEDELQGPGRVVGMSQGRGLRTLRLSEPGRYVFTLPPFPGFEVPGPLEVEARAGETVERVVELVRER